MKKRRNLHACAAIMQKGGAHQTTQRAERAKAKRALRRELDHWKNESRHPDGFFNGAVVIPAWVDYAGGVNFKWLKIFLKSSSRGALTWMRSAKGMSKLAA